MRGPVVCTFSPFLLSISTDELKSNIHGNRLIPPFNPSASDPSEVYSLHDIIPEAEWKAISTHPFKHVTKSEEFVELLPHRGSNWLKQHVNLIVERSLLNKKQMQVPDPYLLGPILNRVSSKLLYYISVLFAFRQAVRVLHREGNLEERMAGVPSVIVDGLTARFTETPRGSTQ